MDCKETLKKFLQKAECPLTEEPDYDDLRNILMTELEKHRNELNYDKFDWQIPRTGTEFTLRSFISNFLSKFIPEVK